MRLSDELINELISEIAGAETALLVEFLKNKSHVSEFKLSEKLDVSINQVRNMIYRLDEHNLVSFARKKDKKKGWYEYYWTFDLVKARSLIIDLKKEKIKKLRDSMKKLKNDIFYSCNNERKSYNAEEALELGFRCPECGEILQQEDNLQKLEEINEQIKKLKEQLKEAMASVEVRKEVEFKKGKKKVQPVIEKPVKKKVIKKPVKKTKKVKKPKVKKTKKLPKKKHIKKTKKKPKKPVKKKQFKKKTMKKAKPKQPKKPKKKPSPKKQHPKKPQKPKEKPKKKRFLGLFRKK